METRIERLTTPDGDFLDIHHLTGQPGAPLLLLLHGLEGTVRSHYIQGSLLEASRRGWNAAVMVFRSCGSELNRTRRFYHSGETTDLAFTIDHLLSTYGDSPLIVAGFSLGGNVLLKYLGERQDRVSNRIRGAVAVSVPYDLARAAQRINSGFSKIYQRSFIESLKSKATAKCDLFPDVISARQVNSIQTIRDFDNCITAPLHGFRDADDYYTRSSAIGWLSGIRVDTLLLSAVDDPFLPPQVLDDVREAASNNQALHLEFTTNGGHVGFVSGRNPFNPAYYLEDRVGDFLAGRVAPSSPANPNGGSF